MGQEENRMTRGTRETTLNKNETDKITLNKNETDKITKEINLKEFDKPHLVIDKQDITDVFDRFFNTFDNEEYRNRNIGVTIKSESEIITSDNPFEEIAGQDEAVKEAMKLVLAINNPDIFKRRGVKQPKGILMYGPPGTGKTLLAKCISKAVKAEFISVTGGDVQSKWINGSVELIKKVFEEAIALSKRDKKVVLFFDEIDAIGAVRSDATTGSREDGKVVSLMLQYMDGINQNPNITILATSNRPENIDPALKRPGRIDKILEVGLPKKDSEREAILRVHVNNAQKQSNTASTLFSPDLNLLKIAESTNGLSGAELANLINLVLEEKVYQELEGNTWTPTSTEELLSKIQPYKISQEEKRRFGFNK